jgi:hypothetical protein
VRYRGFLASDGGPRLKSRSKADPGALSIAPPDGYQYGDDHPWDWDETKQQGLSDHLDKLRKDATTKL